MSKRGRKIKVYPFEEINMILYNFTSEYSPGLLKPLEIYRYAIELFENGTIKNKYSEDFWRKPGRQGTEAIVKANHLYVNSIKNTNDQLSKIVNTEQIVDKLLINIDKKIKKQLISSLKINEKQAEKVIVLNRKISRIEEDKLKLRNEIESLKEKLIEYQKIIFSWTLASHISNDSLFNITKSTNFKESPVLQFSFNKLFDEEVEITKFFELYLNEFFNKLTVENEKVVKFEESRIKKLLQDEI